MIVYPAIDIRGGRVVRLLYGDPSLESVYSDDPVATAERWRAAGATWLHVISLDGALGEDSPALEILSQLAATGLSVQFGGGLRTLDAAAQALEAGASRIILGTLAVREPEVVGQAIEHFGTEAVVVALDAKNGRVASDGWQQTSEWSPIDFGQRIAEDGVRHVLYTDISKDGDLSGVNVEATAGLAEATGLDVIASGGVARLDDINQLKATEAVAGVIIGRALYAGMFTLEDALQAAAQE